MSNSLLSGRAQLWLLWHHGLHSDESLYKHVRRTTMPYFFSGLAWFCSEPPIYSFYVAPPMWLVWWVFVTVYMCVVLMSVYAPLWCSVEDFPVSWFGAVSFLTVFLSVCLTLFWVVRYNPFKCMSNWLCFFLLWGSFAVIHLLWCKLLSPTLNWLINVGLD